MQANKKWNDLCAISERNCFERIVLPRSPFSCAIVLSRIRAILFSSILFSSEFSQKLFSSSLKSLEVQNHYFASSVVYHWQRYRSGVLLIDKIMISLETFSIYSTRTSVHRQLEDCFFFVQFCFASSATSLGSFEQNTAVDLKCGNSIWILIPGQYSSLRRNYTFLSFFIHTEYRCCLMIQLISMIQMALKIECTTSKKNSTKICFFNHRITTSVLSSTKFIYLFIQKSSICININSIVIAFNHRSQ